jgi:hypothetical protein
MENACTSRESSSPVLQKIRSFQSLAALIRRKKLAVRSPILLGASLIRRLSAFTSGHAPPYQP